MGQNHFTLSKANRTKPNLAIMIGCTSNKGRNVGVSLLMKKSCIVWIWYPSNGYEGQCLSWWKLGVFEGLTLNNKLTLIIFYFSSTLYT